MKKNNNYDCIAFSYYKVMNNEKKCYDDRKQIEILEKKEALIKIWDERYFQGFTWNKLLKRSVIKENELFFDENIKINEDLLFWIEAFEKLNEIAYFSTPYYYYIQIKSSALHSKCVDNYITALTAYEKIEKIYIKNNIRTELFNINFFCINLIIRELLIDKKNKEINQIIKKNLKENFKIVLFSKEINFKRKFKLIVKYFFIKQFCFIKKIYYKLKNKI